MRSIPSPSLQRFRVPVPQKGDAVRSSKWIL
jgi:hypothetical protein